MQIGLISGNEWRCHRPFVAFFFFVSITSSSRNSIAQVNKSLPSRLCFVYMATVGQTFPSVLGVHNGRTFLILLLASFSPSMEILIPLHGRPSPPKIRKMSKEEQINGKWLIGVSENGINNSAMAEVTTGNTCYKDYDPITKTTYYVDYSIIKTNNTIESVWNLSILELGTGDIGLSNKKDKSCFIVPYICTAFARYLFIQMCSITAKVTVSGQRVSHCVVGWSCS